MGTTSTRLGWAVFLGFVVVPFLGATGLVLGTDLFAQQPVLSCEQSLKETEYKRNAELLQNRTLTDAFARELRVAVERAEKAETALAHAKAVSEATKPAPAKQE